jgi:hypothetical protein
MGLNLHYLLTAHSDLEDATGTRREQLLMGLGMKTFHDYPVIDDSTEIADEKGMLVKILEAIELAHEQNCFRVLLQPLPADHAVTYWTAGSMALRLSAYYQVCVTLLGPRIARSRSKCSRTMCLLLPAGCRGWR